MFTLAKEWRFAWPVSVPIPGQAEAQQFQAQFRVLPQSRIEALAADPAALLREAITGWGMIRDEAGTDVPFSPEARDALLDLPFVLLALANAYADAMSGQAQRKN
jgi:hypothetical protein